MFAYTVDLAMELQQVELLRFELEVTDEATSKSKTE